MESLSFILILFVFLVLFEVWHICQFLSQYSVSIFAVDSSHSSFVVTELFFVFGQDQLLFWTTSE